MRKQGLLLLSIEESRYCDNQDERGPDSFRPLRLLIGEQK